jgi:4-hydroxybenzoate polyprenyltransferase
VLVDALATVSIALLAGAGQGSALRLGLAMFGLQAAIGALNDVVDAPRDAGRKPGKPIPAGLVTKSQGLVVAASAALAGVLLSVPSGATAVALALAILAIGAVYDLRLKGTALSWLPFAVGIPLLPVFAWLGSGSALPAAFLALVPAAALAGAALAIGNALVDVERDRSAGVTSIAAHLGPRRAWRTMVSLYLAVMAIAVATALASAPVPMAATATALPSAVVLAGAALAASGAPARRERGWQLQAVGVALLAAGWLIASVVA